MPIATPTQRSNLTLLAAPPAAGGSATTLQKFKCAAYNGDSFDRLFGLAVVDLATLEIPTGKIPALFRHGGGMFSELENPRLGFCETYRNTGRELIIEGTFTDTDEARRVIAEARQGYPWQCSVGLDRVQQLFIPSGSSVEVNGRTFEGPITVFRPSRLRELSILELGADATTEVELLRSQGVELLAPCGGSRDGSGAVTTVETFRQALKSAGVDDYHASAAVGRLNGSSITHAWARFPGAVGLNPEADWSNSPALRAALNNNRNLFLRGYARNASHIHGRSVPARPGSYLIAVAQDHPAPSGTPAASVLPLGHRRIAGLSGNDPAGDWHRSEQLRQWWEKQGGTERSFMLYARSCMRAGDDYTIAHA